MLKNEIIQQAFNEEKFRQSTIAQLNKEFIKVGVDLNLDTHISDKERIIEILQSEITVIQDQVPQLLAQLLYSFDLNEKKVSLAFQVPQDAPIILAEAMLWRAAQKVYLREKFRS